MLVLSRKPGEEIVVAGNIRVTVVSVKGDRVRIGVAAPMGIPVDRKEVHERRKAKPKSVDAHDIADDMEGG